VRDSGAERGGKHDGDQKEIATVELRTVSGWGFAGAPCSTT
jgi:hypothetical protein